MSQREHVTDELIGAYLDGELTGDEHRRIAQLVASDPHCAATCDQLRLLRDALGQLPRHGLPRDFTELLVRDIGALDRPRGDRASPEAEPQVGPPPTRPGTRRARRLAWPLIAAAVAACLLLAISLPSLRSPREIAKRSGPDGPDMAEGRRDSPQQGFKETGAPIAGPAKIGKLGRLDSLATGDADRAASSYGIPDAGKDGAVRYLVVVEIAMASRASNAAFDRTLSANGILYDRSLRLDPASENELLASRFLDDKAQVGLPTSGAGDSASSEVHLVYVVSTGGQAEQTIEDLAGRRDQFPLVQLDLATAPADVRIFDQLRSAVSEQLAATGAPSDLLATEAARESRAHRVLLQVALISRWSRALLAAGLITDGPPGLPPPGGARPAPPPAERALQPAPVTSPRIGEHSLSEILFVLHHADVGPAPAISR